MSEEEIKKPGKMKTLSNFIMLSVPILIITSFFSKKIGYQFSASDFLILFAVIELHLQNKHCF
jgi:hypothetical protein